MSDDSLRCCRVRVSGRVQGVGFRMATWKMARGLGLRGYAENLANGEVEVLACGPGEAVDELLEWLEDGPPAARVTNVSGEDVPEPPDLGAGFDTR